MHIRRHILEDPTNLRTLKDVPEDDRQSIFQHILAGLGYFSSFTHNGKWYTLESIPTFNRDGLWFKDNIGFSQERSLTDTLVRLAGRSTAGMTADQLGLKLHCRCHAILARLHRCGRLQRQKVGRSYVYLASDADVAARQRRALSERNMRRRPLPAEIAVLVLAEFRSLISMPKLPNLVTKLFSGATKIAKSN